MMRALRDPAVSAGRLIRSLEDRNASRYTQGLQQLAGTSRHGGRARPDRRQFRDLGHRRHFPRLRPLDRRQDRLDRDHGRPVPPDLQRPPAAARPPVGRPVTPDQARALRLDQQLAGQLVAEAALDQRARQMRLNLSDAEVARQIMADPNFRGPSGQFDRARFEQMIRQAGYTEPRFVAEQKRLTLRREIADTVSGELTRRRRLEQASIATRTSSARSTTSRSTGSKAGEIAPPTPEAMSQLFRGPQGGCSARPNIATSWCCRSRRPSSRGPTR